MKNTTRRAPHLTHRNAATICERALVAMGLGVERARDVREGYDFVVEGAVRIAVRYASPACVRSQTYRKRNGELSHYAYRRWTFNFHRHGKRQDRYCDFFVCLLEAPSGGGHRASEVGVYTIPWEEVTGLTFCSSTVEGRERRYKGQYAPFENAWHLIEEAARGGHAAAEPAARKILRISTDDRRRLRLVTTAEPAGEAPRASNRAGTTRRPQASEAGSRQRRSA